MRTINNAQFHKIVEFTLARVYSGNSRRKLRAYATIEHGIVAGPTNAVGYSRPRSFVFHKNHPEICPITDLARISENISKACQTYPEFYSDRLQTPELVLEELAAFDPAFA